MKLMEPDATILVFWMLSLKPAFPLSSFTFIKRLFSSSLLFFSIIVVSSVYLRLLMFLYTIWFQLVIVPHDFRLFRQCTYSNSVSLHSATYIGPFLCPITRKKSGEMPRFFLSKKSMTCCRVADSKKEQGLSPFSYMQKKKKNSGAFCVSNFGYSAHGIFLARILEWVAMHSFRESSRPTQGSNLRLLHLRWCRDALPWAIGKPKCFLLLPRFWSEQDKSGVSREELYDKDG